ncbi:hypothetical protein [Polaromonas sp. A23]|uniref:hypothetical protein n=1 Tax=Polaromonas sp. A23 TaxID=1944133 RepID=UPI000986A664|nr:hypothetical protein [Polaromonas sp. A23]OOG46392.1 hypothetical protein B0B52_03295 [Polaromonas sp. A23]
MRHLLLALLIAVLPVRGWVGHAMAVDMASQHAALAQAVAAGDPTPMPEDCPMHAQMADTAAESAQASQAGMLCQGCDTCQLCLAMASFTGAVVQAAAWLPHAAPMDAGLLFNSADQPSGIKPPIS